MNYLDAAIVRPIEQWWNTIMPETVPDLSWIWIAVLAWVIILVVDQTLRRAPDTIVNLVLRTFGREER